MTNYVLQAVEDTESVDAEVIDRRWLDRASIDWDTVGESIKKDEHVLSRSRERWGRPTVGGWPMRSSACSSTTSISRCNGLLVKASPSISRVLERAAIAKDAEVPSALVDFVRP